MTVKEIKKVKKFFEEWENRLEIVIYQIIEKSGGYINTYNLTNLSIEDEDGIIYFKDLYEEIYNQDKNTKCFLISSAELIYFSYDKLGIGLKDKTINICVIK